VVDVLDNLPKVQAASKSAEHGPHPEDFNQVYTWQNKWEFQKLLEFYFERAPKRVLELGTAGGGTLYWWLDEATADATVVSVDSYSKDKGWYGIKDNRHLYSEWTHTDTTLHVIEGTTWHPETWKKVALLGPFDWIFIDAGHNYEEVNADWVTYRRMAAPGAIVAFHDIFTQDDGLVKNEVRILWQQIQRQGYLTREIVALTGAYAWGIGVVYLP